MKKITILGSTGSIGVQTLEVVRRHRKEIQVVGLACGKQLDKLIEQINEFSPTRVFIKDEESFAKLRKLFPKIKAFTGENGISEMIREANVDLIVNALVGFAGVIPTITAIEEKTNIALANKESLVACGHIIMKKAEDNKVRIFPIDSEHNAMWQCLHSGRKSELKKILITCSGGPFSSLSLEETKKVTKRQALKHPNWTMGSKVTIDSATVTNKALEIIEAKWLFNISKDQIIPILHKESIIHSMIEFNDNSIIAQMSNPNMSLPISYALMEGNRFANETSSINFNDVSQLNFEYMNQKRWEPLQIVFDIFDNPSLCAVFNSANEANVNLFLNDKISFYDITERNKKAVERHKNIPRQLEINEIIRLHNSVIQHEESI